MNNFTLRSSREVRHDKSNNQGKGCVITTHHVHQLKVQKKVFGEPGWICDGCLAENPAGELRYHCFKGCDFDLCGSCVKKDVLPETVLTPLHAHPMRPYGGSCKYDFLAVQSPTVTCDECGKTHLNHSWWNCAYGCNYDLCLECFEAAKSGKKRANPSPSLALGSSGEFRSDVESYSPLTHFAYAIPNQTVFDKLCYAPTDQAFTNTKIIKVVYSVTRDKLHFLNTQNYKYHFAFVTKYLKESWDLGNFNKICYEADNRPFILGSLTHFVDQGRYTFDIWPGDTLKSHAIAGLFKSIQANVFFADALFFRPMSGLHAQQVEGLNIPLISSTELHQGLKFQPLTLGKSFGYLRFFLGSAAKYDLNKIEPTDIVVCEETPIDLPAVTGLITAELQTPLCHVALLCQNRVTPNMALAGAHQMEELRRLEGQCVQMLVTRDKWEIKKADSELQALAASWFRELLTPKASVTVKYKLLGLGVMELQELKKTRKVARTIGAKAAGLVTIAKKSYTTISPIVTDYALVLPFDVYHKFLSGCANMIAQFAQGEANAQPLSEKICAAMQASPVAEDIIAELHKKFAAWEAKGIFNSACGLIFRSSTNVEDLPGFNGAGLYSSEPVKKAEGEKVDSFASSAKIVDAIKKVYLSVWSKRAIVERRLFGINQADVQVAILIQPFFSGQQVLANGVGITRNPFRNDYPAHFLNVQVSGHAVTDGQGTPEQLLVYDEGKPVCEIVSRSSLNGGQPLLHDEDVLKLWLVMKDLHARQKAKAKKQREEKKRSNCVDVEFLVLNNPTRDILVLQCRPLKMTK